MKKHLLISLALTAISTNSFAQKIIEGKAANDKIQGAAMIRMVDNRTAPDFIRLSSSSQLSSGESVSWMKTNLGLNENESLEPKRTENDELGFQHVIYQHFYSGVPVEYSEYRTHSQNNKVISLNGQIYTGIQLNITPNISIETAIANAKSYIGATTYRWESISEETHLKFRMNDSLATYAPQPTLVIVPMNGNYNSPDFRLCYKMDIYAIAPLSRSWVYVDANTGEIVWKTERIHDTDTPGTAQTAYSGTKPIITDSFSGTFRLRESGRGNGIETYDMNEGTEYGDAVDFTDADNNWGITTPAFDQYAQDAHYGAEQTYDYYFNVHNRNSLDNNGFKLVSYVHFDQDFANAFWDGQEMTYGDGDGGTFDSPLTTIDIAGHEITHGLTENTANLVYEYESGALNESFSDIFGVTIDNFGNGTTGNALWRIGEQCTSSGNGIRLMSNPSAFGDPDTFEGTNWVAQGGADNGGVHSNSGVQNFWYYLMCSGGTGTNDNGDTYNLTAMQMADAADIAYRNLTVYLGANSTFADSRFYSIQSAIDLFGGCSPEVIKTTNAWHAVGVGELFDATVSADFAAGATNICTAPATINFQNLSNNATTYTWYFGDGQTSTDQTPAHTYSANGTYSVSLAIDGGACGADSIHESNYITVALPDVPTTADQSGCGTTAFTLESTGIGDSYWYDSPNGNTAIFIGEEFETPPLPSTTIYYVEDRISNGGGSVGPANNTFGAGGNHNNTSTQYIEFTANQSITIETVRVFSGGSGNRTVQIWDNNGNLVESIPVNIGSGNQVVTLNVLLQPGSYRIGGTQMNLYRNNAGASFPYSLAGLVDITGSSAGSAFYYYFYDWSVSSHCISERVPVTVTIDPVLADFSYTSSGTTANFTNTSTNGVAFSWFFGDGGSSTDENPSHTYASYGTYEVTLVTDNGNCTDTTLMNVTVSDVGITEFSAASIGISPNPFNSSVSIQLEGLEAGNNLTVVAINSLGQKVADVYIGKAQDSEQEIIWNTNSSVGKGVYLLRISYDGKSIIRRVVKN
jgi:Zn-dependent metalloprotease